MLKSIEERLVADWRWVVQHAWSVRFMVLACLFEGAGAVLPRYEALFDYNVYSLLSFACTVAAIAARFIAQEKED